jgi:lysophospholipase L1-like esterase
MREKFKVANAKIADFLKHQRKAVFLDVWPVMLNAEGVPKPEIFQSDRLHMNAIGYHLWQPLLEALLLKEPS